MWTQEFWDARYGSAAAIWSGNPNPQLVAQVAGPRSPERRWTSAAAKGADAIWLAAQAGR